jgi:hypothetical protein
MDAFASVCYNCTPLGKNIFCYPTGQFIVQEGDIGSFHKMIPLWGIDSTEKHSFTPTRPTSFDLESKWFFRELNFVGSKHTCVEFSTKPRPVASTLFSFQPKSQFNQAIENELTNILKGCALDWIIVPAVYWDIPSVTYLSIMHSRSSIERISYYGQNSPDMSFVIALLPFSHFYPMTLHCIFAQPLAVLQWYPSSATAYFGSGILMVFGSGDELRWCQSDAFGIVKSSFHGIGSPIHVAHTRPHASSTSPCHQPRAPITVLRKAITGCGKRPSYSIHIPRFTFSFFNFQTPLPSISEPLMLHHRIASRSMQ